MINYLGQGSLLLRSPGAVENPFYNWLLCLSVIALVVIFKTSSNLASAYGIAVTGTMAITTLMLAVLLTQHWQWPRWVSWPLIAVLAVVDLTYFASNLTKLFDGGWFPVIVGLLAFTLLTTWAKGRQLVRAQQAEAAMPVEVFVNSVGRGVHRIRGTAVYLTSAAIGIPPALLHNLRHNQVLHERVLLTTVQVLDVPFVDEAKRLTVEELGTGLSRVVVRYGFSEDPDIPAALDGAVDRIGSCQAMTTSYFLSRQTILSSARPGMARWREQLFGWKCAIRRPRWISSSCRPTGSSN